MPNDGAQQQRGRWRRRGPGRLSPPTLLACAICSVISSFTVFGVDGVVEETESQNLFISTGTELGWLAEADTVDVLVWLNRDHDGRRPSVAERSSCADRRGGGERGSGKAG